MDRHAVVQCSLLYLAVIWLLMKEFCNSPPLTSFGSWAILCFKILIAIKKQLLRPAQEINRKNIYAPFETGDPGSQNWRKMWANNKTSFHTFIKNSMHTSMQRVRFGQKQYGTYFSDQRYLFCCVKLLFYFFVWKQTQEKVGLWPANSLHLWHNQVTQSETNFFSPPAVQTCQQVFLFQT